MKRLTLTSLVIAGALALPGAAPAESLLPSVCELLRT